MEHIIQLIQDRNMHLERFCELNENEILNFAEGNFDNLEMFYNTREGMLKLIHCIDRLLDVAHVENKEEWNLSELDRKIVIQALNKKNDLTHQILAQDLQILSMIEDAKSKIIKELAQVQAGRKALQSYQGPKQDARLDEKA